MKKTKKIDELYRDRFRNVGTTPPPDVWQNIAQLPQKRQKRRLLPLWIQLAGTAAAIALIFGIYSKFSGTSSTLPTIPFVIEYNQNLNYEDPVSSDFYETMSGASKLLQEIMGSGTSSAEVVATSEDRKVSMPEIFRAEISGIVTEEKPLRTYTFSDYLKLNPTTPLPLKETPAIAEETPEEELVPEIIPEEKLTEETVSTKRFSVRTTAAALYFDDLQGGNPLGAGLAGNKGGGDITISYGMNLAYQLTEKVKIRTGVSKLNLTYNTQSVDYNSAAMAMGREEQASVFLSSPGTGSLSQDLGFIEIPLEMEYALLNKRFGVNIIGGASTLVLDENRVILNSQGMNTDFGEAGNVNNISFSTNIGVGLEYNVSQQFRVNLEPIFKYQLNAFNNTSGSSPYVMGIYSGLSYRF